MTCNLWVENMVLAVLRKAALLERHWGVLLQCLLVGTVRIYHFVSIWGLFFFLQTASQILFLIGGKKKKKY